MGYCHLIGQQRLVESVQSKARKQHRLVRSGARKPLQFPFGPIEEARLGEQQPIVKADAGFNFRGQILAGQPLPQVVQRQIVLACLEFAQAQQRPCQRPLVIQSDELI